MAINPVPEPVSEDATLDNLPTPRPTIVPARELSPERGTLDRAVEWLRETVSMARERVQHTAEHYPLQLIMGLGAAAFVGGVALRIWRSNRYARKQSLFRKWRA